MDKKQFEVLTEDIRKWLSEVQEHFVLTMESTNHKSKTTEQKAYCLFTRVLDALRNIDKEK